MSFKPIPLLSGDNADFIGDITVSGSVLGTGNGDRITNNGIPYLLSGDSPAENDTLQDVTTRGNTTNTSIISTGPYISGVTGLFSSNVGIGTNSPADTLDIKDSNPRVRLIDTTVANDPAAYMWNSEGSLLFRADVTQARANTYIRFDVDQSEKLRITDSGNVGIGTNSPDSKLQVKSSGSNIDEITLVHSGNTVKIAALGQESSHGSLYLRHNNGVAKVRLSAGGNSSYILDSNVGIGTASPSAALEVVGGIKLSDNSPLTWATSSTRIFGQSGYMQLQVAAGDVMRLTSSGNVGIGTTSPLAKTHISSHSQQPVAAAIQSESKLVISGTDGNMDLLSRDDNSTVANSIGLGRYSITDGSLIHKFGIVHWANTGSQGSNTGDRLAFSYGASSDAWSNSELVTIKRDGNVGIGNTAPLQKLSVNGIINSDTNEDYYGAWMSGNSAAGQDSYFAAGTWYNNAGYFKFIQSGTPHRLSIYTYNTADHVTLQEAGGNVGIGTVSPNNFGFLETALQVSAGSSSSTTLQQAGLVLSGSSDADDADDFAYLAFTNHQSTLSNGRVAEIRAFKNGTNVDTGELAFFTVLSERMRISSAGAIKFNNYGAGTFTGTVTQKLGVDSSGNVIEMPIGAGPVDGSGTANYLARWIDSDTLGIGAAYDNGTNVGIGTTSPAQKLEVVGQAIIDGGVGVNSSGTLHLRQKGNTAADGLAITSSHGTSHRIWKDVNGKLNIGPSSSASAFVQDLSGNVGIGTTSPEANLHILKDSANGQAYERLIIDGHTQSTIASGSSQAITFKGSGNGYAGAVGGYGNGTVGGIGVWGGSTNSGSPDVFVKSGNVGIGTTSPETNLHIWDSESGQTATNVVGLFVENSGDSNSHYVFQTATGVGKSFSITNAGDVGIGTTSPNAKLHVNHASDAGTYARLSRGTTNIDFDLGAAYAEITSTIKQFRVGTSDAQSFHLVSNDSNRLSITSSGEVGIGTTSPIGMLSVVNPQANTNTWTPTNEPDLWVSNAGTSNSYYAFGITTSSGDILSVTNAGNVGIGVTGPEQKLHVANGSALLSSTSDHQRLYIRSTSSHQSIIYFGDSDNAAQGRVAYNNSSDQMYFNTLGSTKMTILSGGNVGIGTTNPNAKLNVAGDVRAENSRFLAGRGTAAAPAYRFHDDGDTGMFNIASNILAFATSGSERIRISSAGAIKFNTYGAGTFTGTVTQKLGVDSSGNVIEMPIGAGPVDGSGAANYLARWIDSDTLGIGAAYDNGTNVGIGTTTPSQKLTVEGNIELGTGGYIYGDTTTPNIRLSNAAGALLQYGTSSLQNGGSLQFVTASGTVFRVNSGGGGYFNGGRVGIGTTSPSTRLQVASPTATSVVLATSYSPTNTNNFFEAGIVANDGYLTLRNSGVVSTVHIDSDGDSYFNGGNVGIGTASPSSLF